ncbi:hypothetical protein A4R26_12960 [Niastella populi]|uniref:Uncharacterized protein n=1 Tax=Niastella populi TaxID=550983 RepID=A0A1V9G7Q4_9BACT|nr:hypothetical protein A4R26_12960 [Niastella populi]
MNQLAMGNRQLAKNTRQFTKWLPALRTGNRYPIPASPAIRNCELRTKNWQPVPNTSEPRNKEL